jgi:hypothetical protein
MAPKTTEPEAHERRKSVDRLLHEQLEDGGWNCEAPTSKRSSFHTTICVLEGLLEYEKIRPQPFGGPE